MSIASRLLVAPLMLHVTLSVSCASVGPAPPRSADADAFPEIPPDPDAACLARAERDRSGTFVSKSLVFRFADGTIEQRAELAWDVSGWEGDLRVTRAYLRFRAEGGDAPPRLPFLPVDASSWAASPGPLPSSAWRPRWMRRGDGGSGSS